MRKPPAARFSKTPIHKAMHYPETVITRAINLLEYFYATRDRKADGMRGFNKKCDAGSMASLLKSIKIKNQNARPNTVSKTLDEDNRQLPLF